VIRLVEWQTEQRVSMRVSPSEVGALIAVGTGELVAVGTGELLDPQDASNAPAKITRRRMLIRGIIRLFIGVSFSIIELI